MERSIPRSQQVLARAFAAHQAGNIPQAEVLYRLVLQVDRQQFDALHMLGVIEAQRGNFAAGVARINEALRVRPKSVDALINLGRMQSELGRHAEAAATYQSALALDPRSALAHNNLSIVLRRQRQYGDAIAHSDAALEFAPNYADAWNNRGNVLFDLGRFDEALVDYDRAIALSANIADAHLGRGNALKELNRHDAALPAYDRALSINAQLAKAWFGRGNVLAEMQRHEEALLAREKAFALMPNLEYAEGGRIHSKLHLCDWTNLEEEVAHLLNAVRQEKSACLPFMFLPMVSSAADQLKCTECYVKNQPSFPQIWRGEIYAHERIRIAYVSSDLREHPVAHLTAGLFEHHDSSRLETIAISLGPAQDSELYRRMSAAFDQFIECRSQSDQEISDLMRSLEIDIAVDLNGYTQGGRRGIFARRAAPIQVNYLGYAATMGADYYDYIIADQTVIPQEQFEFYREKVVRLPDSFMVTDDTRIIAEQTPSRGELQLPETGFVFCCFNQSYKINPAIFDVWMRLLQEVDGSVLWLRDYGAVTSRNLRREAERRGVAPERLIFAGRVPMAEDHLARQRQADLFLDTLNYNAHTTASDALWAGVPVLTCLGSTFAGRVAASQLRAVGLPELVTESLPDYEALALKISTDAALCSSLKDRLARDRKTCPLFDTRRFARNLEAAYTTMWRRVQRGEAPQSFVVDPA
jgi:predicted O-linked N-acetylglucosamine transferase (SPINDLY family)